MPNDLQGQERSNHHCNPSPDSHEEALEAALRQSEQQERSCKRKAYNYFGEFENWIAALTFLAVFVYTGVTLALWWEQIRANAINQGAFASSVSASVYFGRVEFKLIPQNTGIYKTGLAIRMGNSGGSSTRNLQYVFFCKPSEKAISDPFDVSSLMKGNFHHTTLAPKEDKDPIACTYTMQEVAIMAVIHPLLYIFGIATYDDTVNKGEVHTIEICQRLSGFAIGAGMFAISEDCAAGHNCRDDECQGR